MDKPASALTHHQYEVLTASPTFKPWLRGWAAARVRSFFKDSLGLLLGRSRRLWDGAIAESSGRLSPWPRPSVACSGQVLWCVRVTASRLHRGISTEMSDCCFSVSRTTVHPDFSLLFIPFQRFCQTLRKSSAGFPPLPNFPSCVISGKLSDSSQDIPLCIYSSPGLQFCC